MALTDKNAESRVVTLGKWLTGIGFVLILGFIAGLQHFVLTLPKSPSGTGPPSDGIVVITGGQQRLATGLHILQDGVSKKMLVSGVGPGVNKAILANELGLDAVGRATLACCVELEFEAGDTRGNAVAAARWVRDNQLTSILLVTANYHMPRAALVFQTHLPQLTLNLWPVSPHEFDPQSWWQTASILRLLGREYAKYLTEYARGL